MKSRCSYKCVSDSSQASYSGGASRPLNPYAHHASCGKECKKYMFHAILHCTQSDIEFAHKVKKELEKLKLTYFGQAYPVNVSILCSMTAKTPAEMLREVTDSGMTKLFIILRTFAYLKDDFSKRLGDKIINICNTGSFNVIQLLYGTAGEQTEDSDHMTTNISYCPDSPDFRDQMRAILLGASFEEYLTHESTRRRCEERRSSRVPKVHPGQSNSGFAAEMTESSVDQQQSMKRHTSFEPAAQQAGKGKGKIGARKTVPGAFKSSGTKLAPSGRLSKRNQKDYACTTDSSMSSSTDQKTDNQASSSSGHRGDISSSSMDDFSIPTPLHPRHQRSTDLKGPRNLSSSRQFKQTYGVAGQARLASGALNADGLKTASGGAQQAGSSGTGAGSDRMSFNDIMSLQFDYGDSSSILSDSSEGREMSRPETRFENVMQMQQQDMPAAQSSKHTISHNRSALSSSAYDGVSGRQTTPDVVYTASGSDEYGNNNLNACGIKSDSSCEKLEIFGNMWVISSQTPSTEQENATGEPVSTADPHLISTSSRADVQSSLQERHEQGTRVLTGTNAADKDMCGTSENEDSATGAVSNVPEIDQSPMALLQRTNTCLQPTAACAGLSGSESNATGHQTIALESGTGEGRRQQISRVSPMIRTSTADSDSEETTLKTLHRSDPQRSTTAATSGASAEGRHQQMARVSPMIRTSTADSDSEETTLKTLHRSDPQRSTTAATSDASAVAPVPGVGMEGASTCPELTAASAEFSGSESCTTGQGPVGLEPGGGEGAPLHGSEMAEASAESAHVDQSLNSLQGPTPEVCPEPEDDEKSAPQPLMR